MKRSLTLFCLFSACTLLAADPLDRLPKHLKVEAESTRPRANKIVIIVGTNFYKPNEHDYILAGAMLHDLLKQTPDVEPIIAFDWPKKPETLTNVKSVVFFFDGGDKHHVLKEKRLEQMQKLIDSGVGLVSLHQTADYPKDLADRAREWTGGAWEKSVGKRAHWVEQFKQFPDHPIFNGVKPFSIDDGWLWKIKFVPEMKGITPLLRTVNPKSKDDPKSNDAIIAWAYERPRGGRSVTFTGGHLHQSFDEEGYRKFLINSILWSTGADIHKEGAPVELKK